MRKWVQYGILFSLMALNLNAIANQRIDEVEAKVTSAKTEKSTVFHTADGACYNVSNSACKNYKLALDEYLSCVITKRDNMKDTKAKFNSASTMGTYCSDYRKKACEKRKQVPGLPSDQCPAFLTKEH